MSWLFYNSAPLAQAKNELLKAYENGIRKLWVINVGAIKPLEADIEFIMTYAWEIGQKETRTGSVKGFLKDWYNNNFGSIGDEAAALEEEFRQLAIVRRVEHLKADIFSFEAYGNEAARFMNRLRSLFERTRTLLESLDGARREAFFEVFAIKVYAAYFTYASFHFADKSRLFHRQGFEAKAEECVGLSRSFDEFKKRALYYYNKVIFDGKWDEILTPEDFPPPCMSLYPETRPALKLSPDDNVALAYEAVTDEAPLPLQTSKEGFMENDGYVSILAAHFEKNSGFKEIKRLGRFEGSLMEAQGGSIEYCFNTVTEGSFKFELFRFPSLNSVGRLRIAVSVDGSEPLVLESEATDEWRGDWKQNVMNSVEKMSAVLPFMSAGKHTLTITSIDRYIAFSKLSVII